MYYTIQVRNSSELGMNCHIGAHKWQSQDSCTEEIRPSSTCLNKIKVVAVGLSYTSKAVKLERDFTFLIAYLLLSHIYNFLSTRFMPFGQTRLKKWWSISTSPYTWTLTSLSTMVYDPLNWMDFYSSCRELFLWITHYSILQVFKWILKSKWVLDFCLNFDTRETTLFTGLAWN